MAEDGQAMIAIALLVDSSAALASEWTVLCQAYIMPMLRRLGETNPPGTKVTFLRSDIYLYLILLQFRIAFITYGTQGSPIMCKNFFVDLMTVMAAIRDDTSKLGMGQTTCGGGMGMAALEGFVAAVEVLRAATSFAAYAHWFI
jgi:hypothetical protein